MSDANSTSPDVTPGSTPFHLARRIWSRMNDLYLNIDTSDAGDDGVDPQRGFPYARPHDKARHQDSIIYRGADYLNIRRMIRFLAPGKNDVFYDIGCGKGRCLCMFARLALRRVVGIELDSSLSETARKNAAGLRGKRTPIDIRCEDAATADYSDGTIYFMYNPFGPQTVRDVLANIERSVIANPRKITLVYYDAMFGELLRACPWLQHVHEFKTLTGHPVAFFVHNA
jgi:SAM-dependent methyltransferase